jgi:DNA-binding MarR family transcriptional regulator
MGDKPDIDAVAAVVYQAFSLISRRAKQLQTSGELTLPERVALARLDRGGPSSAADMPRVEQISPQAMRVRFGSFESRGLMQRELDPEDGR